MTDQTKVAELGRLFNEAAQAHHGVTPGPGHEWERWYAEFLEGEIDSYLGFSPDVDEIADWLTWAAEKHRTNAPDSSWPDYYAELILDLVENDAADV